MRANNITPQDTLLTSEAYLVASPTLATRIGSERLVEDVLIGVVSALRSRDLTYISMNVPERARDDVMQVLPSEQSPTVTPLNEAGWLAISSVVPKSQLREIRRALQLAGARDVIGNPLEQIFLIGMIVLS